MGILAIAVPGGLAALTWCRWLGVREATAHTVERFGALVTMGATIVGLIAVYRPAPDDAADPGAGR